MKYIFFKNLANDLCGAYHELSETGLGIEIGRRGPEHRIFVVVQSSGNQAVYFSFGYLGTYVEKYLAWATLRNYL